MLKILSIILILSTSIYALNLSKCKAKLKNGIVQVKCIFKSSMIGEVEAKKRNQVPQYIKHIVARENGKIVYDININDGFGKHPFIKFQYKYLKSSSTLDLTVTDNTDKQTKISTKIKHSDVNSTIPDNGIIESSKNIDSSIWKVTKIEDAIETLYGSRLTHKSDNIKILSKDSTRMFIFPFSIKSNLDAQSLAIFIGGKSKVTLAVFSTVNDSPINYYFTNVKSPVLEYNKDITTAITVVVKDKEGKLHRADFPIEFISGCQSHCYGGQ